MNDNSAAGLFDVQRCRVCGCTDAHACEGGCYWVEEDLCSSCVEKASFADARELMRRAWEAVWELQNAESTVQERIDIASQLKIALGQFLSPELLPEGWELCGACGEPIAGPECVAAQDVEVGPLCGVCAEAAAEGMGHV